MSFAGRPRHSHPNTAPFAALGSSLVHWVRFDLDQVALAGNKVTQARDRFTHNDVVQATSAQRPTWTAGGQSARSYAAFDHTTANSLTMTTGFGGWNAGDGAYVWAVGKWDLLGTYVMTSNYAPLAAPYDFGATVRKNNVNACQFFVNLGGGLGIRSVATPANSIGNSSHYFIEGWIDPGAGQIRCSINGGPPASTPVTNFGLAQPIGRVAMGKRVDIDTDFFNGRIYEVGAAKTWSPSAQTALRQYFHGYYGL